MNVSAKVEYACLAALELATHFDTGQPLQIRRIAESHGIPSQFLVQILLQLKAAGIVQSTRGAGGGYRLARHPSELTLSDIMEAAEGQRAEFVSSVGQSSPIARVLHANWQTVADAQHELLSSVTLAELAEQVRTGTETMYYI